MMRGSNIHYELSGRIAGTSYGGMGAMHTLVQSLGLVQEIDQHLELLKIHLPYHESDHVLNVAYNILSGGERLEDIEQDSVPWIDRAIHLVRPVAGRITLRGDTDFTHTAQLDRRDQEGIFFILGMDAHPKVVQLVEGLAGPSWRPLERLPKYEILTEPRRRPERVKEQIVVQKGCRNQKLVAESVSDITCQPGKCQQKYRLVILRKNLSVQKGERVLFAEVRYFFYLTNRWDLSVEQIVGLANGRCDQENVIEQLKNGVNAMRMPVHDLVSNWAYMVMAALAWNLKAWYGLLVPERERGLELVRMEFRRFLHAIILLPVQIRRAGRRIVYRLLGYNGWLKDFFATWQRLPKLELVE